MRRNVFTAPLQHHVEEVPVPQPRAGEVLIKVDAVTLCGSDLRNWRGEKKFGLSWPTTFGHEVAGRIAAVGEGVHGLHVDQPISVEPWFTCGKCTACTAGDTNLCPNIEIFGYKVSGGLAEYAIIPAGGVANGQLFPNHPDLDPAVRALAEPLACVYHGHVRSRIASGASVLIMGGGPIGLLHVKLSVLAGATNIIVSEPSASRREFALRHGAHHVVDPLNVSVAEVIEEVTDASGVDSVIVCIGHAPLIAEAISLTRSGGVVNAFAGFGGDGRGEIDLNDLHYRQIDLVGGAGAVLADYAKAVQLIEDGEVELSEFITDSFSLDQVPEALERAASGDAIKVVVRGTSA